MSLTDWVMKYAPAWIGLCVGWFAAVACFFWLKQGPLVFLALPAIGYLIGLRISQRLDRYE